MRRHAKRGNRRIPIPSTSLTVLVILSAILFLTLAFAACRPLCSHELARYFRSGTKSRSWKSKLKSVSGEAAFMRSRSTVCF